VDNFPEGIYVSAYAHGQFVGKDVLNCLMQIMDNIDLTESKPLMDALEWESTFSPKYASIFSVQSVAVL
jgi:hypothetical protein